MWEVLERKYNKRNTRDEKYVVVEYFDFKMLDDKSLLDEAHDVKILIAKITARGILVDERLQVLTLINKFLPSWSDFQVPLKHKRVEMSLDDDLYLNRRKAHT